MGPVINATSIAINVVGQLDLDIDQRRGSKSGALDGRRDFSGNGAIRFLIGPSVVDHVATHDASRWKEEDVRPRYFRSFA